MRITSYELRVTSYELRITFGEAEMRTIKINNIANNPDFILHPASCCAVTQ